MLRLPFTSVLPKTIFSLNWTSRFFSTSPEKQKTEIRLIRSKTVDPYDIKTKYSAESWKGLEELYKKERILSKMKPEVWHQAARDLGLTRGQVRRFFWYKSVEYGILNPDKWLDTIPKEPKKRVSKKPKKPTWAERVKYYRSKKEALKQQKQATSTPSQPSSPKLDAPPS